MTKYNEIRDVLIDLTTSEGLTRESTFPTSGTVTFKGTHDGEFYAKNATGSEISYVADVELTVNYETEKFTGKLFNFKTTLEGFENPEGELTVSGSFRHDLGGDETGFHFPIKAGTLTQGERTATFDAVSRDKGRFYGFEAQFMALGARSTFQWIAGPDKETTSETLGFLYVQVN